MERSVAGLESRTAAGYLLLFLTALVAYTLLWPDAPLLEGDSPQYLEVARDLSDGRLDALYVRTPGYPLLLVLTGSSQHPTRALFVVSLLLHVASIWLLAAALRACGAGHKGLLLFAALLSLPPFVEPAGYVMTENLAQFTLVSGFTCLVLWFVRRKTVLLLLSAVAFACSALTRPAYQALAIALSLCLLLLAAVARRVELTRRDALKASVMLVSVSLLILGGFSWMNFARFNYLGVTPSLGFHLSTKTMAFVERLPDEYAAEREILVRERGVQLVKRGGPHSGTQTIWSVRAELAAVTGLSQPELSKHLLRMNLTLIRRAPIEYCQEVARSLSVYWFPAAGPLANMSSTPVRWLWALLHLALVAVFFVQLVALAGLAVFDASMRLAVPGARALTDVIRATAPQMLAYVTAGGIVFYTMILSCLIDIGEARQRRATDVLFVFMCFLGGYVWYHATRRIDSTLRTT